MKCLVMIRASTEAQKIEDQHNEMVQFCKEQGYDELVFVEDKGASAIKLNDQYMLMIQQVKDEIERDSSIRCFAVWELSRAFRNEGVYYEVKTFLLERGIQFICKNPYLKLLDPDGGLNPGMELAMSMFATLAKQEMQLKKERFRRAKASMRKQGKFTGGKSPKYGYRVGDDGYVVIDEQTSKVVRLIFELYATGKYSAGSLYKELKERGYEMGYDLVARVVSDRAYIDGLYPQMVSQELWDKCEEVRKKNLISVPKGRKYCFGSGIFKCSVCGRSMIVCGEQYRCLHHYSYKASPYCENDRTVNVSNLDGLLWWVASREETVYRMKMDMDRREEYEKQVEVLKEKRKGIQKKLVSLDEKRKRIIESYIEGIITKEERKKRLSGVDEEVKRYKDTILVYKEKIEGFLGLLEGNLKESVTPEKLKGVISGVFGESDLKIMNEIVKKHIRRVTAEPMWFGKDRDKRAKKENAQLLTIETVHSGVLKYVYCARKYKKHLFFFYGTETPLVSVQRIIREKAVIGSPKSFKKIKS